MGYSTPMLEQYNKYNSTHNVSVSDNYFPGFLFIEVF